MVSHSSVVIHNVWIVRLLKMKPDLHILPGEDGDGPSADEHAEAKEVENRLK